MTPEETKKLLDRLARIEGQVRGLRNMLDDGRCCEDVLTQLMAARSGLESASVLVLEKHLNDGVFSVQLGPTGEGSDAPTNPLTTDLATALAGDAGITAPVRFLEVTVGGDGALTRTQILSSAYALRATSALRCKRKSRGSGVICLRTANACYLT
jgi:DNA-binding FrmR family transcriptional regulator